MVAPRTRYAATQFFCVAALVISALVVGHSRLSFSARLLGLPGSSRLTVGQHSAKLCHGFDCPLSRLHPRPPSSMERLPGRDRAPHYLY